MLFQVMDSKGRIFDTGIEKEREVRGGGIKPN
jgi:hypothetical protein